GWFDTARDLAIEAGYKGGDLHYQLELAAQAVLRFITRETLLHPKHAEAITKFAKDAIAKKQSPQQPLPSTAQPLPVLPQQSAVVPKTITSTDNQMFTNFIEITRNDPSSFYANAKFQQGWFNQALKLACIQYPEITTLD